MRGVMSDLRFDGRVVIVTGAGAGLGRQHALMFAALGAKVLVNDLGGAKDGSGRSYRASYDVVEEILDLGGEAVPNHDSVENGAAIVASAVKSFGTVDVIINNAGILRDVSFHNMELEDWDLVNRVHLNGSMSVTHAAWPIFRAKGYGRVIMTTSAAGLYGNFGQANYSAAKMGVIGLANTLGEEGAGKGIHVNTIAPLAASRLTEKLLTPEVASLLKPEAVSPLVAWLCHEDCTENKGIFEVGAGYVSKVRLERSKGVCFSPSKRLTADDIKARWSEITDFRESNNPANAMDALRPILERVQQ